MVQATGEVCERMNGIQKCIVSTTLDNGVPGDATGPVQRRLGEPTARSMGAGGSGMRPRAAGAGGPGRVDGLWPCWARPWTSVTVGSRDGDVALGAIQAGGLSLREVKPEPWVSRRASASFAGGAYRSSGGDASGAGARR